MWDYLAGQNLKNIKRPLIRMHILTDAEISSVNYFEYTKS